MSGGQEKTWVCSVCGYVHHGPEPPDECPVCGASAKEFEEQVEEEKSDASESPRRWICIVCDYIHVGDSPPDVCPVCGAPADCFEPYGETKVSSSPEPVELGPVVIIGAGIAGLSAAEAVRNAAPDAPITLISQEDHLPYYRLNLTRFLAGDVSEDELTIHPRQWYEQNNLNLQLGATVNEIDTEARQVRLSNGQSEGYEKLILTAGAHSFIPPISGVELDGVTGLRTIEEAKFILEQTSKSGQCICIGGGILGLEIAGALAKRGVKVTLIESFPWLMPRQLSEGGGNLLQKYIEELGVQFVVGAKVKRLVGEDHVEAVALEDGTQLDADVVVLSAGVRSNLDLARSSGLEVNQGVKVNNLLQTSHSDIYAAGDVAEHDEKVYGLWTAAQYQGKIAGMNVAGQQTEFVGIPSSTQLKVVGFEVASIGVVEEPEGAGPVIEEEADGKYARFVFLENRLVGVQLIGDASLASAAKKAVEGQEDFSEILTESVSKANVEAFLQERFA